MNISEEFAAVAGRTIYVKRWTPGSNDVTVRCPIILLHDSIGCVDMWRQFPIALARRLRRPVIAFDRWGYGRSSPRLDVPSARFISEEAETFFPGLKEHMRLRDFIVLGHSVGGAMAVVIASRFPNECRAVITEAAQAFVEQKTLAAIKVGKVQFAIPQELAKLAKYHGEKAGWVVRAWTDRWLSADFAAWNLYSELAMVKCPLLAIHGDRDEYGSLAFPDALASATSNYAEKMIVRDCGHIPHRERESVTLDAINNFLIARQVDAMTLCEEKT